MPGMTTRTYEPQQLLGGDFPRRFATVIVAEGQVQPAGAVLGQVEDTDAYALSLAAADDGSEEPTVVLWEAVDASDGPVPAEVLLCGDVRAAALTIGTGHTVAAIRKALRRFSLFVHE